MSKSKKVSKAVRKEVKKEVKAIKKSARKAPVASRVLRQEAKALRSRSVRGKGGYWGDVGGKIGNIVDTGVGMVKAITGVGDYRVKSNSLYEGGAPPKIRNGNHSTTFVSNPEYICDIKGSVDFSIQKFSVNPGIPGTFPWLAPQAQGYEQYKPKGILFQYRPTCGDAIASTNNALGTVIMASEYNVNLPDFSNKQQMEDHDFRTPVKPDCEGLHPIECARSKSVLDDLYIRNGSETVPDLKFYDLCNFYIATQGMQTDGVTIGELWVTYEFEFLKPALSGRSTNNIAQHWYWDSNLGVAPSSSKPIQNLREKNSGTVTTPGTTSFGNLQVGNYLIFHLMQTAAAIGVTGSLQFSPTVTDLDVIGTTPSDGDGTTFVYELASGSSYATVQFFSCSAPTNITALKAISGGTMVTVDVWIIPFGSQLSIGSRRPIEYDPLSILNRKIMELSQRLDVERFRQQALLDKITLVGDDEKYCYSRSDPPTPCSSPIYVDEPGEQSELSRSTVDLLLDRLNIRNKTSKTGSHVSAA